MNSTTLLSTISRVADTLVAGNALGTTFRTVRRRELVTDSEEMLTIAALLSALSSPLDMGLPTSGLIPHVERGALVGPTAHIAHLEMYLPLHGVQRLAAGAEALALMMRSNADEVMINII